MSASDHLWLRDTLAVCVAVFMLGFVVGATL